MTGKQGQDKQTQPLEKLLRAGGWGLGVSERRREAKDVGEIQQGLRKPSHTTGASILSQAFLNANVSYFGYLYPRPS